MKSLDEWINQRIIHYSRDLDKRVEEAARKSAIYEVAKKKWRRH